MTSKIYDQPWKHFAAAFIGLATAYAGALWAIDSGRLLVYAGTAFLIGYAVTHLGAGFKAVYDK